MSKTPPRRRTRYSPPDPDEDPEDDIECPDIDTQDHCLEVLPVRETRFSTVYETFTPKEMVDIIPLDGPVAAQDDDSPVAAPDDDSPVEVPDDESSVEAPHDDSPVEGPEGNLQVKALDNSPVSVHPKEIQAETLEVDPLEEPHDGRLGREISLIDLPIPSMETL